MTEREGEPNRHRGALRQNEVLLRETRWWQKVDALRGGFSQFPVNRSIRQQPLFLQGQSGWDVAAVALFEVAPLRVGQQEQKPRLWNIFLPH